MPRKNLLLIYTDQMHKFALGCMGTPDILTPNLDQLAKEGILFRNMYTNCPICSPYRINLVTGLYTRQTNTYRNQSRIPRKCVTLADELNRAGYHTSFVGKWHVGDNGNGPIPKKYRGGFTDFIGYQCYNGFWQDVNFYDEDGNEHHYDRHRTDVTAEIAIERLDKIKEGPFALIVGFQAPHYPVEPSPEYDAMYKGVKIQKRKNMVELDPYTPTYSPRSPRPKEFCGNYKKYGNNLDEYLRLYYALVTQIDANVGKIIQALKERGLYDDTIIIFTSDHGDMQGCQGLKNKTLPYEESSGVPLIISGPSCVKNVVSDSLIEVVDLMPTCLEMLGVPTNLKLPGKSIAPLCNGKIKTIDNPIFSEMPAWKMVRSGDLKLVTRGKKFIPKELFDLKNDPYEMVNLVNEPSYQNQVKDLRTVIRMWQKYCKSNSF